MNGTTRPLPEQEDEHPPEQTKLTKEQVARLRQRYEAGGITVSQLAEIYGISRTHCHNIIRYRSKG